MFRWHEGKEEDMGIAKSVIIAGVVLIVALVIYMLVVNTVTAQNTAGWDAFGVSFFTSMGPMLLILVAAIGILMAVIKLVSGAGEGI